MTYRGFTIKQLDRSYIGEHPIPSQRAVYRLVGRTLKELEAKIDQWVFDFAVGEIVL